MTTQPRTRIGPEMERVIAFVADHPGCCKLDVVRGLKRTYMRMGWAYGPVDRALRAGLIRAEPGDPSRYRLFSIPD